MALAGAIGLEVISAQHGHDDRQVILNNAVFIKVTHLF